MESRKNFALIVMGDIGHSPRMQNHALELSKYTNHTIHLCGYRDSLPLEVVFTNPYIRIHDLNNRLTRKLKSLPFLLYSLLRVVLDILTLIFNLVFVIPKCRYYMLQNPPNIPVLLILVILCKIRKASLIIDFHNYGFSLLQVAGRPPWLVKLARFYQMTLSKFSDLNFCVSEAMQRDLQSNWGVKALVLRDRPDPFRFKIDDLPKQQALLQKLGIEKQNDRMLMISSTSWTPDEDFNVLLQALISYEENEKTKKFITCVITGKGPQKEHYLSLIKQKQKNWKKIQVRTYWLQPQDYPILLAASDFGVCLHYSSSGLDLPMKVVDMFAAGIPVLAIDYACIRELVDERNGLIFKDSEELGRLLERVSGEEQILSRLRGGAREFRDKTFHEEWKQYLGLIQ